MAAAAVQRKWATATGKTSGPGPPDGMTLPAASMMLITPLGVPNVGQNSKKTMGAEGRSRTGIKTSLVASGAGFSVMMVPSAASSSIINWNLNYKLEFTLTA